MSMETYCKTINENPAPAIDKVRMVSGRGISDYLAWFRARRDAGELVVLNRYKHLDSVIARLAKTEHGTVNYNSGGPGRASSYTQAYVCTMDEYRRALDTIPAELRDAMMDYRANRADQRYLNVFERFLIPHEHVVWECANNTHKWIRRAAVKIDDVWTLLSSARFEHGFILCEQWDGGWLVRHRNKHRWHYHTRAMHWRMAMREAVEAMRKQRAIDTADNGTYDARKVFVSSEDSLRAGNCLQVTNEFSAKAWRAIGAQGECAVRADLVLALRDDSYSRRACVQAAIGH